MLRLVKNYGFSMALSMLFLGSIPVKSSEDWPRWRGPHLDGTCQTSNPLPFGKSDYGLRRLWVAELGSAYSCFSVVGKHAVTMGSDAQHEYIISLDAHTGAQRWRKKIGPLYVGHDGSHDGPNSTPVIDGQVVYGLGAHGGLYAVELSSGKTLWKRQLTSDFKVPIPFHGFTTVPLVVDDILIVLGGGESAVIALDKNSGKLLWTRGEGEVSYQSPILVDINGVSQLIAHDETFLRSMDPKSGQIYWQYELEKGSGGLNPLFIPPNRIFMGGNGRLSFMLEVAGVGNQYTLKELWRSSHLGRSFNPPVHHKGFIFGYTGRFLTCLNAKTGEMTWKSRSPGDGFLIIVDDYLLIQAKSGDLHVAKASGESYEEVSSTKGLDPISWNPPVFANGVVFARNLTHGAAFAVDQVDQAMASSKRDIRVQEDNTSFGKFIRDLRVSDNKRQMLDEFFRKQQHFPIIESTPNESYVHIVYRGQVQDISLVSDLIDTNTDQGLTRIDGTDFFFASFRVQPAARLNYRFLKNFDDTILDPLNPKTVPSIDGNFSSLEMPGYKEPDHLKSPDKPKGKLETFSLKSQLIDKVRNVAVYLPEGYQNGNHRYPVVYVHYGSQAMELGKMPVTLDNLIGKTLAPMIVVFLDSPRSFQEYAREERDAFAKMVCEELVPRIDRTYRTIASPEGRGIMGGDEGGYAAAYSALKYPGTFSKVATQSMHLLKGSGGEEIIELATRTEPTNMAFHMEWGSYDYRNKQGNYNWIHLNKSFAQLLLKKGYQVETFERQSGWGWASWRVHNDDVLAFMFPKE